MKKISGLLSTLWFVTAIQCLPRIAFSNPPLTIPVDANVRVGILSQESWINAIVSDVEPRQLVITLENFSGVQFPVATFIQDGPSSPQLVSAFEVFVEARQALFLIVKWHYYLPGVDTEGDFYEVHAYDIQRTSQGDPRFLKDPLLSGKFGSGFDGKQEGKRVHFPYKDAQSILQK
ncbi:hypothetical protein [Paraburkholderia phosphatilytica]|uniref:hypothetical protein n=1 Tax=Paraburkholderia phosphatilytica TaxID=2282883 RepID=UPI000F5DCEC9|nr:hypothetical protein [Paraburkholderia phosphatilytica]